MNTRSAIIGAIVGCAITTMLHIAVRILSDPQERRDTYNAYQKAFKEGQVDALWNLAEAEAVYLGPLIIDKPGTVITNSIFLILPPPPPRAIEIASGTTLSNVTISGCLFQTLAGENYFYGSFPITR